MQLQHSDFKNLMVWQKSILFVKNIYRFTKALPEDEKYNLISQIKRAVVSIPSNIAEGQCRDTYKEFLHFLSVARGSCGEIETQLIICEELNFGDKFLLSQLLNDVREINKMIISLRSSLSKYI